MRHTEHIDRYICLSEERAESIDIYIERYFERQEHIFYFPFLFSGMGSHAQVQETDIGREREKEG